MNPGDEVPCTALESDWGDDRPNILMHPPCGCPRCAPDEVLADDEPGWLTVAGTRQRYRVTAAELGETGRATLG